MRELDGVVLLNWNAPQVAPEAIQRLAWDGRVDGRVQLDGRYAFRVTGAGLVAAVASFELARERFPILGKFSFGSGSASFGGGRGHQGQDIVRSIAGRRWLPPAAARSSSPAITAGRATIS